MWARANDSDVLAMTVVDNNKRFMLFIATKLNYQCLVSCPIDWLCPNVCLAY